MFVQMSQRPFLKKFVLFFSFFEIKSVILLPEESERVKSRGFIDAIRVFPKNNQLIECAEFRLF